VDDAESIKRVKLQWAAVDAETNGTGSSVSIVCGCKGLRGGLHLIFVCPMREGAVYVCVQSSCVCAGVGS